MVTSIQISEELRDKLALRKISRNDTYEDIIWDLLEASMDVNEQTKKDLAVSRKEVKEGKVVALEDLED